MNIQQSAFVHKFIPADDSKNKTTLVLLHGTGGNEEDLLPLGRMVAPGAALLGVRGKVLEGSAQRFFRRLAEGVFDEADLIFRTHELARFLEDAVQQYALSSEHLIALGYSNGANIAASLLLLEPHVLSGAILLRAMVPLRLKELPALHGKRVLMEAGRSDPIVPAAQVEELSAMLTQAGAAVTLHWSEAGHGLTQPEMHAAEVWLRHA